MLRAYAWAAPVAAVLLAAGPAAAQTEEGKARKVPWSGYWWPAKQGAMIRGPLAKYDAFVGGRQATSWERNKYAGQRIGDWWGYCHAWSAACVTEAEPRSAVYATTTSGQRLPLGVGDQKGLLTIAHGQDPSNFYGTRYAKPGDDYSDIAPDVLWKYLKLYVKQQGIPLIVDVDAGAPVWNYPVYMYRVNYRPAGGDNYAGMMSLWLADDAVPPDYLGTKVMKRTYRFTFKMRGGAVVAGSGRWAGTSVRDHPDFAWYPTRAHPENPHVHYRTVLRMINRSGRDGDPLPTLPTPTMNVNFIPDPDNPPPPPADPMTPPADPNSPPPAPPVGPDGVIDVPNPQPPALPNETTPQPPALLSPTEFLTMIAHRQNKKSNFRFDVKVGSSAGLVNPIVAAGDRIFVQGSAQKPGYVYLFHIEPDGDFSLIYPVPGQNNVVNGGKAFTIGSDDAKAAFAAEGPPGTHRVLAFLTTRPLKFGNGVVYQKPDGGLKQKVEFDMNPTTRETVRGLIGDLTAGKVTPEKVEQDTGIDVEQLPFEFAMAEAVYVVK